MRLREGAQTMIDLYAERNQAAAPPIGQAMPDADRRLREVAQLRKLWRAFRDPQERLQDERLSSAIIHDRSGFLHVREPMTLYGRDAIRSAVRRWWCAGEYAAIVELGDRIEPKLFDEEPVIWIYVEEAKACMAKGRATGGTKD